MVPVPRSLVLATDLDVLATDHTVIRGDGYLIVRSPSNPTFWFGNLLLFEDAPGAGAGQRWERLFERALADEPLWAAVVAIQVAGRDQRVDEHDYREFSRNRQDELRALFSAGRGGWYVALTPAGEVASSCGIVATGDRGRFQAVETAEPHRRRGICSRLVVDAAAHAGAAHSLRTLVIAADVDHHALGLYESLGFRRRERVSFVCRRPA